MRFRNKYTSIEGRSILFSIIIFIFIFGIFYLGVDALSTRNHEAERTTLTNALQRSIIHSYAVDGAYPESLNYILETYGITFDPELFFVSYRVQGTNIMPELTVIEIQQKES